MSYVISDLRSPHSALYGPNRNALVFAFQSPALVSRNGYLLSQGASTDYPEYRSHVTVAWNEAGYDVDTSLHFPGDIFLSGEEFEECKESFSGPGTVSPTIPGSLYVSRKVQNSAEVLNFYRDNYDVPGIYSFRDLHVTILYSKVPFNYNHIVPDRRTLVLRNSNAH